MVISFWSDDRNKSITKNLNKILNKKEQEFCLSKLTKYSDYALDSLFRAGVIKKLKNWPLHEIRIQKIRFIGDIIEGEFWIFLVARKQGNKLPVSDFRKAFNIKYKFLLKKR